MRGYLLQAIVTVIESLSNKSEWKSVTLEPSEESEKVDVLWEYNDGTKKVVQIKSSQNTITLAAAKNWIRQLKESSTADTYVGISAIVDSGFRSKLYTRRLARL